MNTCFQKVLFFDIGGVLLSNGWGHESRQAAAEKFSLDYTAMNHIHDLVFPIYEMGTITLDQYLDTVVFNKPQDFSRKEFTEFMFSRSIVLPYMLDWLIQWKKANSERFRIISINNEGRELNDYRIRKFRLHDCFDAFVSSGEVGLLKPDPAIFRLALGIAGASADECLYFDDRQVLVAAAQQLGIESYQHKDFHTTKAILESLV